MTSTFLTGTPDSFTAIPSGGTQNVQYGGRTHPQFHNDTGDAIEAVQAEMLRRAISVTNWGATGDGVTDDTTALQAAITAADVLNAPVFVPRGTYLHTGLTMPGNMQVVGAGRASSTLMLKSSASTTTDNITVTAQTGADVNFGGLFDLSIVPQSVSQGRHAVNLNLNADNRQMVQFCIERCYLNASTSVAAARALVNTPDATPVNTMFALNRFIGNRFTGGVQLLSVQDSLTFDDNYFAGVNVGLEISTTGGAGNIRITRNNMVSDGGAIWLKTVAANAVSGVVISDNYMEKLSAWAGGSGNTAMIDVDATNAGEIIAPIITGNQISILATFGGAGKSCVRLKNTAKAIIDANNFHPIDASTVGLLVTTGSTGTFWGAGNKMGAGSGTLLSNAVDTAAEIGMVRHILVSSTVQQAGNVDLFGALRAERIAWKLGTTLASAGTIAPGGTSAGDGGNVFFVSGTTTINTITPRTGPGNTTDGDYVVLIATGAWALGAAGNILAPAAAMTANRAVHLVFSVSTSKWYEIGRGT